MLYIQDFTVYTGEVCEKSVTLTNNRQVAQSLAAYDSLTLTIETQGTTKTVLQAETGDSSSDPDLQVDAANGVLTFTLDSAVTAADNAGKVFNLAVRETTTKEFVAGCKVTVEYKPGGA